MTIHLICSYKGGVGKTTLALSIALNCLSIKNDSTNKSNGYSIDKEFVLIDTNPQNSNIAEDLFFYFHAKKKINSPIFNISGTKYTISPDSDLTFSVYDATDQDPFALASRIQREDDSNRIFIIDTNIHVRSAPEDIFSKEGNHIVYVWFLWGWSSPRLTHQLEAILQSAENIEKSYPKAQMIHVFNLYDFYTGGLNNFSLRKTNTTLKPLKSVLKLIDKKMKKFEKGKCDPVYINHEMLSVFAKSIHRKLIEYIAPDDIYLEELPNIWADNLKSLIESTIDGFPYNILVIPTFFKELSMSIERLIISSPRSLEKIENRIRPMTEFIDVFTYALKKCEF